MRLGKVARGRRPSSTGSTSQAALVESAFGLDDVVLLDEPFEEVSDDEEEPLAAVVADEDVDSERLSVR